MLSPIVFFSMPPHPPTSTLFPYTTLFRSLAWKYSAQWMLAKSAVKRIKALFARDRKSTRLNSSHLGISYGVFCLKKKKRLLDIPRRDFIFVRNNIDSFQHCHINQRSAS